MSESSGGAGLKAARSHGFDADVEMQTDVVPESDGTVLSIVLKISAKNRADFPVPLTEPYSLATEYAQDLAASDESGDLDISFFHGRPSIMFNGRPEIAPNGAYTWTIRFKRRVSAQLERNVLLLRYTLATQNEFQSLPVHSHRFECTFRFVKPSYDRWRIWKEYRTILRDNRKLIGRVDHEADATICRVAAFTVGADDPTAMLHFVCIYGFARRWSHAITTAATLVATVLIQWVLETFLR